VDRQDFRPSPAVGAEAATHASLQLELRVPERQMIGAFRDAFVRWLNDRSGPFARLGGRPERLSLDEVPDGTDPENQSTLRVSVSWSFAPQPTTRSQITLPPAAILPRASTVTLPPIDQFVFFPDPPETGVPIFHDLSPFEGTREPGRQPRLIPAVTEAVARNARGGVDAALGLAQAARRRLALSGLTIRSPLAARGSGTWGAALLGATAIAVGFSAGSIYLATRAARQADPPQVAAGPAPTESIATPTARVPLPAMPPGDALSRVEQPKAPVDVLAGSRQPGVMPPTSSSLGIADTEVTTRRAPAVPAQLVERHPGPVVVPASEVAGPSGADRKVTGALLVKSEPQGAEVSINGVVLGRTPLLIRDLGAGSRVVRLDLAGYARWSWGVAVVANQRTPVTVKLQPESRDGR